MNRVLHSRKLGRELREVRPPLPYGVEMYWQGGLIGDLPDRIPLGIPERHHVVGVGDLKTADAAALDHAPDLFHGGLYGGVGDARETRVAVGMGVAEVGEPLVVNPDQLDGGLGVIQPPGGAKDS